ncbi:periplasmic solute binding protein [Cellulomonas flavigena DSM 20109]|uniref:Periplasmic solute binding protein n=1 Tax=Cellulomonas flavigena (strain ATCC 482 / DSM 20109 / BCRC 11376 / JCM 18109 / NBRC 3775 / NCIMB 8073 / NRS 134) TaxID=446466 RepID=D5UG51_CELFN|nr:metal ABC transporter substrate-binding protein [Cellulomonas flavigena]ADG75074.1 periplasmic solute binding protein [Cellulomonas flavigena DSM 20109]
MSRSPLPPALVVAPALAVLALAGCAPGSAGTGSPAASGGTVEVLASFYPLQMVAQEVGGDRVTTGSLTPPGAEPHDVELSPAQVASVSASQLVVYLSGFQPAVDDAVEQAGPRHVVDAADVADLVATEDEHTEDEHADHGDLDPHFWLDPTRVPPVADAVADALSEIDPEGADTYRANAEALAARLTALDEELTSGLATCERRVVVTSHEAFGYLAARYDLEQVGISGVDPETEPSPARLREVGDVVRSEGVTTVFFETLASPKVARTLAADLGVETAVLDPLEGLRDDTDDYFSVSRDNLEALRVALSCS